MRFTVKHLYLTIIGYSVLNIQQTSNFILVFRPQHKGLISWSSSLFLTPCEQKFPSTKRCKHFLQLSQPVQSTLSTATQVIWNLYENTENDRFFRLLKSLMQNPSGVSLRMKFWSGVWNLWQSQLLLVLCVQSHHIQYSLALCPVHKSVLVWVMSVCFSDLTLKFPLVL